MNIKNQKILPTYLNRNLDAKFRLPKVLNVNRSVDFPLFRKL